MKDCWPFGIVLWGMASNRHMRRWLTTVVVSDVEKAHLMRQVGLHRGAAAVSDELISDPAFGIRHLLAAIATTDSGRAVLSRRGRLARHRR